MDRTMRMAKPIYSMDLQMPPSQTPMTISRLQDMSSWQWEGLLHGNQRNKQLSQCPPQNLNMLCFRKLDEKLFGLETYTNLASHRWDQQSSKVTMKVQ